MLSKVIGLLGISLVLSISLTPALALTELQRATISDPRLENAFGIPIGNNVNVDQQFQISADITNNQEKSQNFVYLVQIKDKTGFVVSFGWISGQLTPDQKLSPSLSWSPDKSGEFTAEIYVWEGLINHKALTEYTMLQINVS
ncbi:MAG: hypothetical protein IH792_03155 [Thaumarchaeota archaeon]|nr:hypothetical protein [Nitrososphaerota archaeon]